MNIIVLGIMACLAALIILAVVLKVETDNIIRDYEFKNQELKKRLKSWSQYSYKQNNEIYELKKRLEKYEKQV